MSTVKATNFQNASSATANMVTDASGNVSFGGTAAMSSSFLRNRIINGDMRVFQRGAVATTNAVYSVDRWALGFTSTGTTQLSQSQVFPTGFTDSLIFDVGTADTSIAASEFAFMFQHIEGNNISDLSWGGANAKSVTLSFWVYTTTIGTFCVTLRNAPATLSYIAEYTVSVANTWEYKTVTVPGPTTGTWATNNATGLIVGFTVAVGTTFQTTANAWNAGNFLGTSNQVNLLASSANEFRVTGVQLEVGTVATPFERQIYSNQLAQCQRYYGKTFLSGTAPAQNIGVTASLFACSYTVNQPIAVNWKYPATMRTAPTITTYSPDNASANWSTQGGSRPTVAVQSIGDQGVSIRGTTAVLVNASYEIHAAADAEL